MENDIKVCVLLSCMQQKDKTIVEKSNVQTDCVVINQCDINLIEEYDFENKEGRLCHVKYISTTERGLSKSRNLALSNSNGDICLVCDDDEILDDNYEQIIKKAYNELSNVSVILFRIKRVDSYPQVFPNGITKLGLRQIFKSSSQQVSFKRSVINKLSISFDEKMGSGTGNGGGEEVKFLMDLKRKGEKIYYYPELITTIFPGVSQWFHGCDEKFLRDKGWSIRRTIGPLGGMAYNIYYSVSHRKSFMPGISIWSAFKAMYKGWSESR